MADVQALEMDVVTEKSNHQVVGMAVSPCLTPPAPPPVPYPLVASVAEGITDSPLRTKVSGTNCATIGSVLKTCHGNEPGVGKEVVSLNQMGPVAPTTGAFTVLIELGPAAFTGSLCDMNKAPTPGVGSNAGGAGGAGGGGGSGAGAGGGAGGPQGPQGPSGGGGGAGGSAGAASAAPAPAETAAQKAARPGNSPDQIAARKQIASDFMDQHGQKYDRTTGKMVKPLSPQDKADQLACINYDEPVKVGPPPPLTGPGGVSPTVGQWQAPGTTTGSYFAPPGSAPGSLGIGATGRDYTQPNQPYAPKQENQYTVPPSTPYCQSTAAPANDTWSVRNNPNSSDPAAMNQPAPGGGTQYNVPSACDPNNSSATKQ
ncbi:MAG TPA: PAAR-like domain-containing protein [Polyangiaceae bacterium]|jgi:hypothetical protein